jgi:hypothetical protein
MPCMLLRILIITFALCKNYSSVQLYMIDMRFFAQLLCEWMQSILMHGKTHLVDSDISKWYLCTLNDFVEHICSFC